MNAGPGTPGPSSNPKLKFTNAQDIRDFAGAAAREQTPGDVSGAESLILNVRRLEALPPSQVKASLWALNGTTPVTPAEVDRAAAISPM